MYQWINGKLKVLTNQINLRFSRAIVVKWNSIPINWVAYALHFFKFWCNVKKLKEVGFERWAKEATLNKLRRPSPQPPKAIISLPLVEDFSSLTLLLVLLVWITMISLMHVMCLIWTWINLMKVEVVSSASNGPKTLLQLLKAISFPHWSSLKIKKMKFFSKLRMSSIYKHMNNSQTWTWKKMNF